VYGVTWNRIKKILKAGRNSDFFYVLRKGRIRWTGLYGDDREQEKNCYSK
jgi:hypothetical protein